MVGALDQFDGRDVSKYLNVNKKEMELNRVLEKEMIKTFELAVAPKIQEHRYKIELFLRVADPELQEKLELLLEDKEVDEGLITNWKDVEDAVKLISKQERRQEKISIRWFVPIPAPMPILVPMKAPIVSPIAQVVQPVAPIVQPIVPIVQPRSTTPKREETTLDELVRGLQDLSIKFARLEERAVRVEARPISRLQARVQWCMWCDSVEHTCRECDEFLEYIRQGVIFWKDEKVALKYLGALLQTNIGKGGMKKIVEDYLEVELASICNLPMVKPPRKELHVRWADEKDEGELLASHFNVNHWARGTIEILVRVGNLEEPIVALIDHGSEINVMAKSLYEKEKWPIDLDHG
ncbi:hypothetical protein R1flu_027003 [Riccia fluitans]|uniref:Gag-pol polyprotein n=1 Tax=Riccia fluitans TaxID=41844 RepID=A0ABD1XHM5_9MARC